MATETQDSLQPKASKEVAQKPISKQQYIKNLKEDAEMYKYSSMIAQYRYNELAYILQYNKLKDEIQSGAASNVPPIVPVDESVNQEESTSDESENSGS